MPIYSFVCNQCGHKDEKYVRKIFPRSRMMCNKCGAWMRRTFSPFNTDVGNHPRWSAALGVNTTQIKEAKKLWPDNVYNEKGDVLILNRKDKLKKMKQRNSNLIELD